MRKGNPAVDSLWFQRHGHSSLREWSVPKIIETLTVVVKNHSETKMLCREESLNVFSLEAELLKWSLKVC